MPCYHPITAYKTRAGEIVFHEAARHGDTQHLNLPCGQCIGCRLERSRQWGVRCMHEAKMHKRNCVVTLTFNEENKPPRSNLDHSYFQKFMKRLRKLAGPTTQISYYMGGEYGTQHGRPHFHACIFGWDFPDRLYFKITESGAKIYTSATLQRLWPFGHSSVGDISFESAAYIARYCMAKVTGDAAKIHYRREDENGEYWLNPEYNRMSNRPAIGKRFYDEFKTDVYNHDHVITNGVPTKPPKYYDKLLKRENANKLAEIQEAREAKIAKIPLEERAWQRREAIEQFQKARIKSLKRGKI